MVNSQTQSGQGTDYRPTSQGSTDYDRNKTRGAGNESMEQCIRDCLACYQECMTCIPHCLSIGGKHSEHRHITLMMECAQLCNMSATLMQLQSEFSAELCQLCARVCDACAESCASIDSEDEMMKRCAEMCRRCAQSCRQMAV
jgi:hypothetical protein